jgi:hypothetical protein
MNDPRLNEILRFLNAAQIRATYGAVAGVIGGIPQSIGARLGHRRPEASWIVNASTKLPTGYSPAEMHPALQRTSDVIESGSELRQRMAKWKERQRGT